MSTKVKKTLSKQRPLVFSKSIHPKTLVKETEPYYTTDFGAAYLSDSKGLMESVPHNSVNLVLTSPPYALHFKKKYGNEDKCEYIKWFLPFAKEIFRVLTNDGSFILNIGGSYNKGFPTRSLYHFKLLIALVEEIGFHLAQECFWYNPAKMPAPAEWVTVRRIRIRDSVEYVWWLSKTPFPKADNKNVLRPYSKDMIRLKQKGIRATVRPSGYNISSSFEKTEAGGSIPPNVLENYIPTDMLSFGNNSANDIYTRRCKEEGVEIHPARFPGNLPKFYINLLTEEDDLVLDPFAGSNTTGAVAESLNRKWLSIEKVETYLQGSKFRFPFL